MLSIIIPTLNEATNLRRTIPRTLRAAAGADVELIVSDCDSRDGTADVSRELGAMVVCGSRCRAEALNRGTAAARRDVLVFVHADTHQPIGFADVIARALADPRIVGGAFDWEWDEHPLNAGWNRACLKMVEMVNRTRFRWTHNFYGDQTIFVRRSVFDRIGGFPPVRLMEDIRFCRQMKRRGRVAILRPPVRTSPRRFVSRGVVRQFLHDLTLLAWESCGAKPEKLWDRYNRWNHQV